MNENGYKETDVEQIGPISAMDKDFNLIRTSDLSNVLSNKSGKVRGTAQRGHVTTRNGPQLPWQRLEADAALGNQVCDRNSRPRTL